MDAGRICPPATAAAATNLAPPPPAAAAAAAAAPALPPRPSRVTLILDIKVWVKENDPQDGQPAAGGDLFRSLVETNDIPS